MRGIIVIEYSDSLPLRDVSNSIQEICGSLLIPLLPNVESRIKFARIFIGDKWDVTEIHETPNGSCP